MEKLKENISETYKTLGINPNESQEEVLKRKNNNTNKIKKINNNSEFVKRKCRDFYIINNKMTVPDICNTTTRELSKFTDIETEHTTMEQLNKELVRKIQMYKSNMNKVILNGSNDKLKDNYDKFIELEKKNNKQTNDNILIEQKNSIVDLKIKNDKHKIKIYSIMMLLLIIINIGGYMFYLK